MTKSKFIVSIGLVFFLQLLEGYGIANAQVSGTPNSMEKRDAEKAWETLIRTKGGREKLSLVENMLIAYPPLTNLFVFPASNWYFLTDSDARKTPLLRVWNGEKSIRSTCTENGVISSGHFDTSGWDAWQAMFLLETKWMKPELLRVRRIGKGKKQMEAIEIKVGEKRLDFVYESEELLVSEVWFYYEGRVTEKYRLSDYADINGIKMPRKIGFGYENFNFKRLDELTDIKIMFNVDYDPKIFSHPGKATTADAWKRKP